MVDVPWPRPLRVLAFGDSNTWGFVASPSGGTPAGMPAWPTFWQASRQLAPALAQAADCAGMAFMDGAAATATSGADRIHLDAADHHRLGQAVASRVRALLEFAP